MKTGNKQILKCLVAKVTLAAFAMTLVTLPGQRASAFIPPQDRCIDVRNIIVMEPVNDSLITKEMIATYMPTNLTPTTDSNRFASQFEMGLGQRITDRILSSAFFKNSPMGHVAASMEKMTQQSFTYTPEKGVTQKVNVAVKAIERQATLNYDGYFKSSLTYASDSSNMIWTISKAVGQATIVSLTNVMPLGAATTTSMISLSHSF